MVVGVVGVEGAEETASFWGGGLAVVSSAIPGAGMGGPEGV